MNTRVNRAPWPMHTRGCIETTLGWKQGRGRGERSGRENDGTRDSVRGGLVGSWRMSRLRNYLMNARGAYECSRCLTRGRMREELLGPGRRVSIHVPRARARARVRALAFVLAVRKEVSLKLAALRNYPSARPCSPARRYLTPRNPGFINRCSSPARIVRTVFRELPVRPASAAAPSTSDVIQSNTPT